MESIMTDVITTVGVALLALLSIYVCKWFDKLALKANEETNKLKNQEFRGYATEAIIILQDLVKTNVVAIEETLKKDLLEAAEDGKLTKEDASVLKNSVIELTNSQLSQINKNALLKLFGDLNSVIGSMIEKEVKQNKDKEV